MKLSCGLAVVLMASLAAASQPVAEVAAKPELDWQRHEFERDGFSCEMPVRPQPLAIAGIPMRLQVVADVPEPRVVLVARCLDTPPRTVGKPTAYFDGVAERLERAGARLVDRRKADLGLHRGGLVEVEWPDGRIETVRSVVVGRSVYELDAIVAPGVGPAGTAMADRFLGSLQLIR